MNFSLIGKTALITGSTLGIGKKTAEELARNGATVYINGRKEATVLPAIEELKKIVPSGIFKPAPGDVSTSAGVEEILKVLPDVDILVNNTGIFEPVPFFDIPDEDWLRLYNVNVMSGVRLSRAYLKGMLERNWGRIVFVSSECGIMPAPEMLHYSLTKTSQIALARGLAELTKGTSVTVNSVIPGPTDTAGVRDYFKKYAEQHGKPYDEFMKEFMAKERPTSLIQRLLTEQEVVNAITYICSPASSGTNGSSMKVEGGQLRCIP